MRWEQFIQRLFKLAQDAHANNLDSPDSIAMIDLLREFPEEIALP
jgi:hypothetical protein